MRKLIYFGEFSSQSLIFLYLNLGYCGLGIMKSIISNNKIDTNESLSTYHPLFYLFLMFFAESLTLIVYFIKLKIDSSRRTPLIKNNKLSTFTVCLFITGLASIVFISSLCGNLFTFTGVKTFDNIVKIVYLLMTCFLMNKIFNYKSHKHHYLGIGLLIFSSIILTIMTIAFGKITINAPDLAGFILLCVAQDFLASFLNIFEKYLMELQYIDPLKIIGLEGLFGSIILIIGFIPLYYIPCPIKEQGDNSGICKENSAHIEDPIDMLNQIFSSLKNSIFVIILILSLCIFNLFRVLVLFYYSPNHIVMANTMRPFLFWVLSLFAQDVFKGYSEPWINIITCIAYLFSLFGMVIFLEFVLISLLDLDRNTTLLIAQRGKSDFAEAEIKLIDGLEGSEIHSDSEEDKENSEL